MKELLVFGDKTFKIRVPDDAKITFGPWSPPKDGRFGEQKDRSGTLRIYSGKGKEDVLAVFAGVMGFRDLSLEYAERVAVEEGSTLWNSDTKGYSREQKVAQKYDWNDPVKKLPPVVAKAKRKR
jgi:hypothetical protein